MTWTPQQLKEIVQFQEVTEALLDELQEVGFKHKQIKYYNFRPERGTASWQSVDEENGVVTMFSGSDPGAVAHELAHGFHECLRRDIPIADRFGEDYAEAIRWFAEAQIGESEWRRGYQQNPRDARILKACNWDWKQFVANLQAHKFFPE